MYGVVFVGFWCGEFVGVVVVVVVVVVCDDGWWFDGWFCGC